MHQRAHNFEIGGATCNIEIIMKKTGKVIDEAKVEVLS